MNSALQWAPIALTTLTLGGSATAQTTELVSVNSAGAFANGASSYPSPSADGRFVAFVSAASNLASGDTNGYEDVFVRDRLNGTTERVSVSSAGVQAVLPCGGPSISADGRFVAFECIAPGLVAGDTNGSMDIFLRDRLNGTTERVSLGSGGAQANGDSERAVVSADGRFVGFRSFASNLVAGDTNQSPDIFVRDRLNGTTERVSVATGGAQANNSSNPGHALSSDGRFVLFSTYASNLVPGDTNSDSDAFVRDRLNGTTERVSVDSSGAQGNSLSSADSLSADGRFVVFVSFATNLVASDTNNAADVFVHDRVSGTTELVSVATGGVQGNQSSLYASISADGRCVAFWTYATNLVAGDTNSAADIFVRDRLAGTTERVSVGPAGVQANQNSFFPWISADGHSVALQSNATNLIPGGTPGGGNVYMHALGSPSPSPFCFGDGGAGACPCGNNGASGRGCENSASSGGALLAAAGSASLANDTLELTSSGELPTVLSIFLQGDVSITAAAFGDGLRCVGGSLKRLYARNASGGSVTAPVPGDASISARSTALGDSIAAGTSRYYQTYYRDPVLTFCANPPGNSWNVSNALSVFWTP